MLTYYGPPRAGLGEIAAAPGTAFAAWAQNVDGLLQSMYGGAWTQHGAATTIPSNVPDSMQPYVGQPAMRLDNATYVTLANSGRLDMTRPQVASNNGQWVYILGPDAAILSAPPTMSAADAAENAIFSGLDTVATHLGLPSLDTLQGLAKEIAVGVAVALAVGVVLRMRKR